MIWAVALAVTLREQAETAEAAMDFPAALSLYAACVDAGGRDARFCGARQAVLAPQAADAFVGWRELEEVRRSYTQLGPEVARQRVEAALRAYPDSPAAPELRRWLALHQTAAGEDVSALAAEMAQDPRTPAADQALIADRQADGASRARDQRIALVGAAVGALYGGVALRGPGPWRWRSALLAMALVGGVPLVMAGIYEPTWIAGFARAMLLIGALVLGAGRAPAPVGVAGALGSFLALGWYNGWWDSASLGR